MEKVDMKEVLRDRKSYSTWLLLHFAKRENIKDYHNSIKKNEPVELSITLNGVELTRVDMDEAMEHIVDNHLGSLDGERKKLENDKKYFKEKVSQEAEKLLQSKMEDLEELFYDVKNKLDCIDTLFDNNISWKNY